MLFLGLALLLQVGSVSFKEPVKITERQRVFLRAEAKKVRERLKKTKKDIKNLEKPINQNLIIKNFVINYPGLQSALAESIANASEVVSQNQSTFNELSENEHQKQAAEVFFGDIRTRYDITSQKIEGLGEASYSTVRNETLRALELNAQAYETVAAIGTETFDLEITSTPPTADISYKRAGESYGDSGRITPTTILNLVYAVWTIRLRKQGFEDQEKTHDPYREKNHVVHFDLSMK
jgi:hypothetical protein